MTFVRSTLLAGIAALAMTLPASAATTVSGDTRPTQPTATQYAQDFSHGMRESNAYKSSKSKKSTKKKSTSGQAKSTGSTK
jgi:hypothetical protein